MVAGANRNTLCIESGGEIMWMEAMGRFKIIRDH